MTGIIRYQVPHNLPLSDYRFIRRRMQNVDKGTSNPVSEVGKDGEGDSKMEEGWKRCTSRDKTNRICVAFWEIDWGSNGTGG